jgi:hypothetical protein
MKKMKNSVLLVTVILFMGVFLACPTGGGGTTTSVDKVPSADDYAITGTGQEYNASATAKTVTIVPKEGTGVGEATAIRYNGSTTAPTTTPGYYEVKFDVAAAPGWQAKNDILAGGFYIKSGDAPRAPVAEEFNISGYGRFLNNGTPRSVSISPKNGSSQGQITIYYYEATSTGATLIPNATSVTAEGAYTVKFNVAADGNWLAVEGLSAGTIVIYNENQEIKRDPLVTDLTITPDLTNPLNASVPYDGLVHTFTAAKKNNGYDHPGTLESVRYTLNGAPIDAPKNAGIYSVIITLNASFSSTVVWPPKTFTLPFTISPRVLTPDDVEFDFSNGSKLTQSESSTATTPPTLVFTELEVVPKTTLLKDATGVVIKTLYAGQDYSTFTTNHVNPNLEGYDITVEFETSDGNWKARKTGNTDSPPLSIGKLIILPVVPVVPAYNLFWVEENAVKLSSDKAYMQQGVGSLTITADGDKMKAGEFEVVEWTVNGILVQEGGTSYEFKNNSLGRHTVSFIIAIYKKDKDGNVVNDSNGDPEIANYLSASTVVVVGTDPTQQ